MLRASEEGQVDVGAAMKAFENQRYDRPCAAAERCRIPRLFDTVAEQLTSYGQYDLLER